MSSRGFSHNLQPQNIYLGTRLATGFGLSYLYKNICAQRDQLIWTILEVLFWLKFLAPTNGWIKLIGLEIF